jgi:hypothetical protein
LFSQIIDVLKLLDSDEAPFNTLPFSISVRMTLALPVAASSCSSLALSCLTKEYDSLLAKRAKVGQIAHDTLKEQGGGEPFSFLYSSTSGASLNHPTPLTIHPL